MKPARNYQDAESEAHALQKRVLDRCVTDLRKWSTQFWVFVHMRSIALTVQGRKSMWKGVGEACTPDEDALIDLSLEIQYKIEPDLRTYNELLISHGRREPFQRVSFSFGDMTETGNVDTGTDVIHFDKRVIADVTENLTFTNLLEPNTDEVTNEKRIKLAQDRLSLGLDSNIRDKFNLGFTQSENPLRALPDEVRYSLQILMLWSNTLKWKYIETHHSPTQFDALSGLVITVCSCHEQLTSLEVAKLEKILKDADDKLDDIVRMKTSLLPRNIAPNNRFSQPTDALVERLFSRTPKFFTLWDGRDAFYFIELLRRDLFAATFEGTPESYSFIFGHPGFIARPVESHAADIKLKDIRQHREKCEGALDRLNVIDVLGKPSRNVSEIPLVPIAFPVWARKWDDTEQALGAALEKLSSVHREMIVVGMICRNVITVFKDGELVCSFDGAWKEIRSWKEVVEDEKLNIPDDLAEHRRLMETYRILTKIAYGPLSRSIIIGYARTEEDMHNFLSEYTQGVDENTAAWLKIGAADVLEPNLMSASKTDGAILMWSDADGALHMRSRVRVMSSEDDNAAVGSNSGGTGTATARSMAKEGNGILSMKVSRDGGMRIWWNGQGPITAGALTEG